MKKILWSLAALFALTVSADVFAGTFTGTVSQIVVVYNGIVLIVPNTNVTGAPPCSPWNSFAVEGSTAAGKNILATIELALVAGRTVTILGLGTCSVQSDRETINSVTLQ